MVLFTDDDDGYLCWTKNHPAGYVLNLRTLPDPAYVVLHRASCGVIAASRSSGAYTCRGYRKAVSDELGELSDFARKEGRSDGSFSKHCGLCKP